MGPLGKAINTSRLKSCLISSTEAQSMTALVTIKKNFFDLSKQCSLEDSALLTKEVPLGVPWWLPQSVSNRALDFKKKWSVCRSTHMVGGWYLYLQILHALKSVILQFCLSRKNVWCLKVQVLRLLDTAGKERVGWFERVAFKHTDYHM